MNSRTFWSIILFEGEIGTEANDVINYIPERGHNSILRNSILLFSSSDARLLSSYFRLSLIRYNSRILMGLAQHLYIRVADPQYISLIMD